MDKVAVIVLVSAPVVFVAAMKTVMMMVALVVQTIVKVVVVKAFIV